MPKPREQAESFEAEARRWAAMSDSEVERLLASLNQILDALNAATPILRGMPGASRLIQVFGASIQRHIPPLEERLANKTPIFPKFRRKGWTSRSP